MVSSKYVKLLSQSFEKYKNLSSVDIHLNPQSKSLKSEVRNEISEQLKRNQERRKSVEKTGLKPLLRRRRKIVVSSSCKQKLHMHSFAREVRHFTEAEDKQIIEAVRKSKTKHLMISELCKELNRPYHSVRDRVRRFMNKKGKRHERQQFTIDEDKVILDEVLKYIHEEKLREIPLPNPKHLSHLMMRGETSLKTRWQYYLKPIILQFYANSLFVDYREAVMKFVANKYKTVNEINWERVLEESFILGHTDSSLKYQFYVFIRVLRERNLISKKESSLQALNNAAKEYFKTTKFRNSTRRRENVVHVITHFVINVRSRGIDNFL